MSSTGRRSLVHEGTLVQGRPSPDQGKRMLGMGRLAIPTIAYLWRGSAAARQRRPYDSGLPSLMAATMAHGSISRTRVPIHDLVHRGGSISASGMVEQSTTSGSGRPQHEGSIPRALADTGGSPALTKVTSGGS